jgi:hypothetical protein
MQVMVIHRNDIFGLLVNFSAPFSPASSSLAREAIMLDLKFPAIFGKGKIIPYLHIIHSNPPNILQTDDDGDHDEGEGKVESESEGKCGDSRESHANKLQVFEYDGDPLLGSQSQRQRPLSIIILVAVGSCW